MLYYKDYGAFYYNDVGSRDESFVPAQDGLIASEARVNDDATAQISFSVYTSCTSIP